MFRNILVLLLIVSVGHSTWSAPLDEINEALARAEALYYEADFNKSIELLLPVDKLLQPRSDHPQEKITVKLQLALAYVGLNDNTHAKAYFRELYSLDRDYSIDPQRFSPKVVGLAEQARIEQTEVRCRTVTSDAERQLGMMGNGDALIELIGANGVKCPGLASIATNGADLLVKAGIEAYREGQTADALQKFQAARLLYPAHELATQYIELTQDKLRLDVDSALLASRRDFDGGEEAAQRQEKERQGIRALLDRYKVAYERTDLAAMRAVFPNLSGGEERDLRKQGEFARAIQMTLIIADIHLSGEAAKVSAQQQLNVRTTSDNKSLLSPQTSITFNLRKRDGSWIIEGITR